MRVPILLIGTFLYNFIHWLLYNKQLIKYKYPAESIADKLKQKNRLNPTIKHQTAKVLFVTDKMQHCIRYHQSYTRRQTRHIIYKCLTMTFYCVLTVRGLRQPQPTAAIILLYTRVCLNRWRRPSVETTIAQLVYSATIYPKRLPSYKRVNSQSASVFRNTNSFPHHTDL